MTNNKIVKQLNSQMKKYLIYAFSLMDHLHKNKDYIRINVKGKEIELDDESIDIYSFFLAGLASNKDTSKLIGKNISFKECLDYFKNITGDFELKSISNTEAYNRIDLDILFSDFIDYVKDDLTLMPDDIIPYNKLEPYQLLDYFYTRYPQRIIDLLEFQYGINEDDFNTSYEDKHEELNDEFIGKNDTIIARSLFEFAEVIIEWINNKAYLKIKNKMKTDSVSIYDYSTSSLIKIPAYCEIISINSVNPNKKFIQDINNNPVDMPIEVVINDENIGELSFSTLKEDIFGVGFVTDKVPSRSKKESITSGTYTPCLDKYGKDLTATSYIKDPAVGRDIEIRRIEQILLYPERDKSIVITGEAGCGKTALVRGLAYRIQKGNVPEPLKGLRIISIDTATLVAGTKYVGTLEEKMKDIFDEASKDKNIIIFMDEIHQALSGGKAENSDNSVAEILKPYLDYGDVRIIGATTTEEYERYVEENQAFKTRLKKVSIKEPNDSVTYEIINDLINKYDEISYSKLNATKEEQDMIVRWLIESTNSKFRTYNDRASNPRLVLDIIKEAYAIATINEREKISVDDLAEALRCEDRLYDSSKERQIQKLKTLKPEHHDCKIIQLIPRK